MFININKYLKNDLSKIYFTSDIELSKPNIILNDKRPFKNEEEMYNSIVFNWNQKVDKDDLVIIVGDLGKETNICSKFLNETNGDKILVIGNNDNYLEDKNFNINKYLLICDLLEFNIENKSLILTHYPMQDWVSKTRGKIHIHGHVHGFPDGIDMIKELGIIYNRYNCTQTLHNYTPVSLSELIELYTYKDVNNLDYTSKVIY